MPNTRCSTVFSVDGYEVSATFADSRNTAAIGQAKQILLSSFASSIPKSQPNGILAIIPEQRDNNGRGKCAELQKQFEDAQRLFSQRTRRCSKCSIWLRRMSCLSGRAGFTTGDKSFSSSVSSSPIASGRFSAKGKAQNYLQTRYCGTINIGGVFELKRLNYILCVLGLLMITACDSGIPAKHAADSRSPVVSSGVPPEHGLSPDSSGGAALSGNATENTPFPDPILAAPAVGTQDSPVTLSDQEFENYISAYLLPGILKNEEYAERVIGCDGDLVIHLCLYTDETPETEYDPIARNRVKAITDAILNATCIPPCESASLDASWERITITFPPYGMTIFSEEDIIESIVDGTVVRHFDVSNADFALVLAQEEFIDFITLEILPDFDFYRESEHFPSASYENKHLKIYLHLKEQGAYAQSITEVAAARTRAIADTLLAKHDYGIYKNVSLDPYWEKITISIEGIGAVTVSKEDIIEEKVDGLLVRWFDLPEDLFC